jgi:hypothetical protein
VIVLQPRAKADLVEIWEFIANESDAHADAFIDVIAQKFQVLAQQPSIGADDGTSWPMVSAAFRWGVTSSSISPFPVGFRSCGFCMGPVTWRPPSVSQ